MHFCDTCNYRTSDKSNYNRHCKSKKHFRNVSRNVANNSQNVAKCKPDVSRNVTECKPGDFNALECSYCGYIFKQRQSLYRHRKNGRCKGFVAQTINNITNNNITNNTNNNLNITLNINSAEEIEKIKSLITPEVILKLCEPHRSGIPRQTYDMIKNISNYSIQLKQENKELQNFKKMNARDNMIDLYDEEKWNKEYFDKYILNDIQKYTNVILKKCEEKSVQPDISRDEKLSIIKEVCQNYEKYKRYDEDDLDGIIKFTLEAIDEQIKEQKLKHYNISKDK